MVYIISSGRLLCAKSGRSILAVILVYSS